MKVIVLLGGFLILFAAQLARAEEGVVTVSDLMREMQAKGPIQVIDYCIAEVPTSKDELLSERHRFLENFDVAVESLRHRIGDPVFLKPITFEEFSKSRGFTEAMSSMLTEVKKLDPNAYCTWLLGSLQKETSDSITAKVQTAYDRYEALSKQKAGVSPK